MLYEWWGCPHPCLDIRRPVDLKPEDQWQEQISLVSGGSFWVKGSLQGGWLLSPQAVLLGGAHELPAVWLEKNSLCLNFLFARVLKGPALQKLMCVSYFTGSIANNKIWKTMPFLLFFFKNYILFVCFVWAHMLWCTCGGQMKLEVFFFSLLPHMYSRDYAQVI